MAWTAETFLAQYPHLAERLGKRRIDLVNARLADAALTVDATVCGTRTDHIVGLRAAHLLEFLPAADGTPSKLLTTFGGVRHTPWGDEADRLMTTIGRANRIVLGGD